MVALPNVVVNARIDSALVVSILLLHGLNVDVAIKILTVENLDFLPVITQNAVDAKTIISVVNIQKEMDTIIGLDVANVRRNIHAQQIKYLHTNGLYVLNVILILIVITDSLSA
jgi:hypothetical protein